MIFLTYEMNFFIFVKIKYENQLGSKAIIPSIFRFSTPILNFLMNLTSRKRWNILKLYQNPIGLLHKISKGM